MTNNKGIEESMKADILKEFRKTFKNAYWFSDDCSQLEQFLLSKVKEAHDRGFKEGKKAGIELIAWNVKILDGDSDSTRKEREAEYLKTKQFLLSIIKDNTKEITV